MQNNSLLTVSEVSKILRINKNSVYKLIKTGQLPAIIGIGATKIKANDVDHFINKCIERG